MVIGRIFLFLFSLTVLLSVSGGQSVWRGDRKKNFYNGRGYKSNSEESNLPAKEIIAFNKHFNNLLQGESMEVQIEQGVNDLVKQWAPLVWLSPEEKYMPSNVEDFLNNMYVADENGKSVMPHPYRNISQFRTKKVHLATRRPIDDLKNDPNSFIYGKNPIQNGVSIYALVKQCGPSKKKNKNEVHENRENLYFHVSYWIFYPFNEGKEVCLIGRVPTLKIFNTCLGKVKTLGNHVGDWEHMSMMFTGKNIPELLYLAVHNTGAYYSYNEENKYFKFEFQQTKKSVTPPTKFPDILRTQGDHPIVFSANGSHGMWSIPGENEYIKVPKLVDKTGYGIPWKTWNNLKIYYLGQDQLPYWMNYRGKWGNSKRNCLLFKKLGICEYSDGPDGIIRQQQDFHCM